MLFPPTDRVIYDNNPLIEVICQLRFAAILRIEEERPVAFQERLRSEYPQYGRTDAIGGISGLPPQVAAVLGRHAGSKHDFMDAEGVWKVALNQGFVALSTTRYERWEDFRDRLKRVVAALQDIYTPAFITRVGLRYRDVIDRSALGLQGIGWKELLRGEIAGELTAPDIAQHIAEASRTLLLVDPDGDGKVRVQHGLATSNEGEEGYLIDADIFSEAQCGSEAALDRLDDFNKLSGRLFRWCITDRLHDAMGPREVQDV